jgi:GH15 family glucan-1,4-alpha-glucosidase
MGYQPIENYGIIGDMHTAALVGIDGSIDWFCFPRFDSASLFAAILDHAKGGRFKIAPTTEGIRHKQFNWPDTNV